MKPDPVGKALAIFWQDDAGQDLVEYSLLLAFIALAVVTLLNGVSGSIHSVYTHASSAMSSANTASS